MKRLGLSLLFLASLAGGLACGGSDADPDASLPDAVEADARVRVDAPALTPASVCAAICAKVGECFGDPTSCETGCPPDLEDCDATGLQQILDCSESACEAFEDCTFRVGCFTG